MLCRRRAIPDIMGILDIGTATGARGSPIRGSVRGPSLTGTAGATIGYDEVGGNRSRDAEKSVCCVARRVACVLKERVGLRASHAAAGCGVLALLFIERGI